MKFLIPLVLVIGCATSTEEQAVKQTKPVFFSVVPSSNTQIITYHVQIEGFSPEYEREFEQALSYFQGKCWNYGDSEHVVDGGAVCLRFIRFTDSNGLRPFKLPTINKKMSLVALEEEGSVQVQNFVWDGAKLQRVRNSDSKLHGEGTLQERIREFMILWALK